MTKQERDQILRRFGKIKAKHAASKRKQKYRELIMYGIGNEDLAKMPDLKVGEKLKYKITGEICEVMDCGPLLICTTKSGSDYLVGINDKFIGGFFEQLGDSHEQN